MLKKSVVKFVGAVAFFWIFAACNIGLGESVDTEAPGVKILTPETSEVVRGSVNLSGSWSDDHTISRVTVTVRNVDTEQIVISNAPASVSLDHTWSYQVLTQSAEEISSDSLYLLDGKYEVKVIAYDDAGHSSGEASRSFEVDSTAPVVALSKPASVVGMSPSSYGRSVKITGLISDDHSIKQMKVRVFAEYGSEILLSKDTFTDFDPADTAVVIAKYFTSAELQTIKDTSDDYKLYENYKAIYGEVDENISQDSNTTKKFSLLVEVTDKAGNVNEITYIKDTLLNLIKTESGVSLEMADLKNILNGSYKGDLDETAVSNIKSILAGDYPSDNEYYAKEDKKLTFSVNPNANPTYLIDGFDYTDLSSSFQSLAKSSTLSIQVSQGLDNIPFYPKDLGVIIYQLVDNSEIEVKRLTSSNIYSNGAAVTGNNTNTSQGTYTIRLEDVVDDNGSSKLISGQHYKVEVTGHDINGNDFIPANGKNFGFVVQVTKNPPTVTCADNDTYKKASSFTSKDAILKVTVKDEDDETISKIGVKAYVKYYDNKIRKSSDIPVTEVDGFTEVKTLEKDIHTGEVKIPFDLSNHDFSNCTVAVKVNLQKEGTSDVNKVFCIFADNSAPNIKFTNGEFLNSNGEVVNSNYKISVFENGSKNTDISDPDNPKEKKGTGYYDKETKTYTVSGKWDDISTVTGSGVQAIYYSTTAEKGSNGEYTYKEWKEIYKTEDGSGIQTANNMWSIDIPVKEEGPQKIGFFARDAVGNETSVVSFSNITFDFATPSLDYKPESNVLTFTGKDSYEVETIDVVVKDEKNNEIFKDGKTTVTLENGDTLTLGDLKTSEKENGYDVKTRALTFKGADGGSVKGKYSITTSVTDKAGRTTKLENIDTEAPAITNNKIADNTASAENDYAAYKKTEEEYYLNPSHKKDGIKAFTLTGVASDDTGVTSVELKLTAKTLKDTADSTKNRTLYPENSGNNNKYIFNFDLDEWKADTGADAVLTVKDLAGNVTTQEFTIHFDTAAPVGVHAFDGKGKDLYFRIGDQNNDDIDSSSASPKWNDGNNGQNGTVKYDEDVGGKYSAQTYGKDSTIVIRGTFADKQGSTEGSGISKVYYKIYTVEPDSSESGSSKTEDFLKDYKTQANGSFTPIAQKGSQTIEQQAVRRVFYTPVSDGIKNNLEENITNEGSVDSKDYVKITSNFKASIDGFELNKTNYLVLVAVDNVGNAAVEKVQVKEGTEPKEYSNYIINIDQTAPVITYTTGDALVYSNGTGTKVLSGTVTDENGAGIQSVEVYATLSGNTKVPFDVTLTSTAADTATATELDKKRSYKWEATVVMSKLGDSGSPAISVTAKDAAGTGNSSILPVATIILDKKAPEFNNVKVVTGVTEPYEPIDKTTGKKTGEKITQVNGTFTLSGEAKDDKALAEETGTGESRTKTLKLYYTSSSTVAAAAPVTGENGSIGTTPATKWVELAPAEQSSNWSFDIDTTDTSKFTDNTSYWFSIAATDKAGNVGYSTPEKVYVNQDTDRPVITITSPADISSMASGNILYESNKLSGTVEDDDSVTYFGYNTDGSTTFTQVTLNNGRWTISDLAEGERTVYFKVTVGGKDYTAVTSTTYNDDVKFNTYKLTDEASTPNQYGYYKSTTPKVTTANILKLKIDTESPEVESTEYSFNGSDWDVQLSSKVIGGKNKTLYIRQSAYDVNEIASMNVKIIETINGVKSETPLVDQPITTETSHEEKNGKKYQLFTSSAIDISGYASTFNDSKTGTSNTKQMIITISDGIKTTETKIDLTVDNTAPVFTFSAPALDTINSGEITVYGTTDELGEKVYYTVSTDGEHAPSTDEGKTLTSWTGYSVDENGNKTAKTGTLSNVSVPAYQEIPDASISSYVYFDGKDDTQRAHAPQLKNYAKTLGLTNNLDSFTDLVNFYVWIKIEDKAGNVGEYSRLVCVDPQGDRPTVTIAAPEKDAESLGGTVKLYGSAEDNKTVESVWVQLLSAKNGTGYGSVSVTDDKITAFEPTVSDLNFWAGIKDSNNKAVYTVQKIVPESNGTHKAWAGSLADGEKASDYAIKANFSGTSWNLKINSNGEFDPAANATEANNMALRVYACDNEKNKSYAATRYFKMDNDTPVFSEVYLKQYTDDDTSKAELKSHALNSSNSVIYVKGKWFLTFTVTDDEEMGSIKLVGKDNRESDLDSTYITKSTDKKSWTVKYPLNTQTGVGSIAFTVKATDTTEHPGNLDIKVNYDNEAPKLLKDDASAFNISPEVKQSSGFYQLASKVSDASSSGTPSGVKAIGFYFMRRKAADEGLIYDPMQKRAAPISTKNLTYTDGLYWMSGSITVTDSGITLGSGLSDKTAYIHAGSYIQIGGVMYQIKTVSGTTITIEESVASTYTIAKIALAQFVDNRKSEYGEGTSYDSETGYYRTVKNDDGDKMVEELSGTTVVSSWNAAIVSRNIPDGPIEIHYTAYDESLNYAMGIIGNKDWNTYKAYTTDEAKEAKEANVSEDGEYASFIYTYKSAKPAYISNNAPRLAAVTVAVNYEGGTDLESAKRYTSYYKTETRLIGGNAVTKTVAVTDAMTVASEVKTGESVTGYKGFTTVKGYTWIIPEMVGGNGKLYYDYNIYASDTNGKKTGTAVKTQAAGDSTNFAEGNPDYDTYEKTESGQSYVVAHETGSILHTADFLEGLGNSTIDQPTWFEYTIYDSTEGEKNFDDSQKATIKVALALQVKDETVPNTVISPLYWKSATDNSVYRDANEDLFGHVELKSDLTYVENGTKKTTALGTTYGINDDKVSGIVVFKGYAYDNKQLKKLEWAIVGSDGKSILPSAESGVSYTAGATYASGSWTGSGTLGDETPAATTKHYKFTVKTTAEDEDDSFNKNGSEAYLDEKGHKVAWQLVVDTSYISGIVAENAKLYIRATDSAGKTTVMTGNGSTGSAASGVTDQEAIDKATKVPSYQMDILPYITGLETRLSKNDSQDAIVYSRTAQGHYPIATDETSVKLKGYNLAAGNADIPLNSTAIKALSSGSYEYTVPDTTIKTINNLNNNDAHGAYNTNKTGLAEKTKVANMYNRKPSTLTNLKLTDDVVIDMWELNNNAATSGSSIKDAVMHINPKTNQIGFGFVRGSDSVSFPANGNSYVWYQKNRKDYIGTNFVYDSNGVAHNVSIGLDAQFDTGIAGRMLYNNSNWYAGNAGANKIKQWDMRYSISLESIGIPNGIYVKGKEMNVSGGMGAIDIDRFTTPSIAASAHSTGTAVYIMYYDSDHDQIRFRYGEVPLTGDNRTNTPYGLLNDSKAELYRHSNNAYKNGVTTIPSDTTAQNETWQAHGMFEASKSYYALVAGKYYKQTNDGLTGTAGTLKIDTGNKGSAYYALDVVPGNTIGDDKVVMIWFDENANELKYMYRINLTAAGDNTDATSSGVTNKWSAPKTIFNKALQDCVIKVDKNGGIHIAAYDMTNADLVYAYLPSYNHLDTASNKPYTCVVDSYSQIGNKLKLDTALNASGKVVPYISYFAEGLYSLPKLATLPDGIDRTSAATIASSISDGASSNMFTGKWEVTIIPTSSKLQQYSVNVGVWKDANGKATNAAKGTDVATSNDERKRYANGTSEVVLGYTIKNNGVGYIETAMRK